AKAGERRNETAEDPAGAEAEAQPVEAAAREAPEPKTEEASGEAPEEGAEAKAETAPADAAQEAAPAPPRRSPADLPEETEEQAAARAAAEAGQAPPEPSAGTGKGDEGTGDAVEEPAAAATAEGSEAGAAEGAPAGAAEEAAGKEPAMPTDPVSLRLLEAKEQGATIQGKVFGWNQGGYHVLIDGLLAFCPRSEIDLGNPKAPRKYIEKKYRFHVLEHRPEGNRFILSRAKALEEERQRQAERTREKLEVGAVFQGTVRNLTTFGAFVDLGGGIEGLVHISELSHKNVGHPKEVVKKGQQAKVKVLKIEEDGKRISLSVKALEPDPWKEFAENHPRGTPFKGKVTGKTDFGVFVEVEPGIEGLVHVSALPPGAKLEDEAYQEGAELSGWVKEVEVKRRRISLSLREVPTHDPWKGAAERYPEGEVVTGTVEEIAPFGVFIQLEPGLTGLLPNSEMKLPRGTHTGRVYPPGSQAKVQVGRVDTRRKRISLLPEGVTVAGSQSDYKEFKKRTQETVGSGMPTLAAAFEKLKEQQEDSSS
ncbi:MAG: S1 RNA-binding domain-containing protein, partial [Thermoanaerobaculia bacterium]